MWDNIYVLYKTRFVVKVRMTPKFPIVLGLLLHNRDLLLSIFFLLSSLLTGHLFCFCGNIAFS